VGILTKIMIGVLVWCVVSIATFPFVLRGLDGVLRRISGTTRDVVAVASLSINLPALSLMYASESYFSTVMSLARVGSGGADAHRQFCARIRERLHLDSPAP
jgi:hypothetical protein